MDVYALGECTMQEDHKSDEILLAQEMKRIILSLRETGPQDVYQLAEPDRNPADVERTVQVLVSQNLLVERLDFPATPDPLTKVYSIPTVKTLNTKKPTDKLPSW